jgi:hypothetical protein
VPNPGLPGVCLHLCPSFPVFLVLNGSAVASWMLEHS